MNDNQPSSILHPAETLIAAYAIGKCSQEEQARVDEHCFVCEECRTRLSILLRVSAVDSSEMERRQLERLFPLGMETIAQARQTGGQFAVQSTAKDRPSLSNQPDSSPSNSLRFFDRLAGLFRLRPLQVALAVGIVALIAGGGYYQYTQTHSPLQNSLIALQSSYRFSRPLEARVTGNFRYQPYERKRGATDNADIDRDQINYALAELTKAVASHPTPETRHALGRLYLLLGDFDKAEDQMKAALSESSRNARLFTDLAALYYERSKYGDSVNLLSKAIEHYNSAIEIDPRLAEAWFNRALCYEQMALFDRARQDWNKFLELDPNSAWADEARQRLKKLQVKAASPAESNKNTRIAIEKAAESNDEAALRQLIGQNFAVAKQLVIGQMLDHYLDAALSQDEVQAESSLKTIRRMGQLIAEIKGDHYVNDLADFASRASPKVKSGMQSVRLLLRQADSEFERSSHDAAFKLYQSAFQMAESIGDQSHAEIASLNLLRYPNFRTNEELTNQGTQLISLAERHHHLQIQAQAHTALANAYLGSQQNALALENSLRATEIAAALGDVDVILNSLRFSSAAYARSGDYERALGKNFEALSSLRDQPVSLTRRALAYHQVGETFFMLGNYPMALSYQQEALQIALTLKNPVLLAGTNGRLGLTLWKLGRNDEAKNNLDEAISRTKSIGDQAAGQLLQAELYTTLGDLYLDQNKAAESIAIYQLASQTIKKANNRVYLSAIHQGLASAYRKQGKISKAEAELQISLSLAERDRQQISDVNGRSAFLASRQDVYQAMVDLQFNDKHSPVAAFDYAEIAKSRNVLDLLSQKTTTQWRDGQVVLSLSGNARPMPLKQIQRSLPHNVQILSYAITEKKLLMWLVTNSDITTASVEYYSDKLQKSVSGYLADLRSRRDFETLDRKSADLYRILISPVESKLDANRLLCVVPDGPLYQLPFAALLSPGKNRYLIEDYSIITNPSASILVKTAKLAASKRNAPESFLGVSNPLFNYRRFPGLPMLPSSDEEVDKARAFYQQSELLKNDGATETALAQSIGRYGIAHIAGHVLIDGQSPLQSSILLAEERQPAEKERKIAGIRPDGTLQALEIFQLKLPRTRLVILSGCQSAVGDYTRGEALSTLAQAFFAAGVPSVIASLWEVDDATSAEIMYSFHYNHRVKHQSYGEALSQAMRSLIYESATKRRHPYYWAAFLLTGDGLDNGLRSN